MTKVNLGVGRILEYFVPAAVGESYGGEGESART